MGPLIGNTVFDTIMIWLPFWLPAVVIGCAVQWLIVRSATLSALRKHERDQADQHQA